MVINKADGIYRDENNTIVTPLTVIYANSKEIDSGIPTTGLEIGFLINTENLDVYSLAVDGLIKKWKKLQ